jgi:hypothetical protein
MADDIEYKEYKCAGCEKINTLPKGIKKFICTRCGAPNTPLPENFGTGSSAGGCVLPTGFEFRLPAGKVGTEPYIYYVTPDSSELLDRGEWVKTYGYDPKAKLEDMRLRGEQGVPGYLNTSTLAKLREKLKAQNEGAKKAVHLGAH